MCIVIDTNTLASVLNQSVSDHREFRPVREWIYDKTGMIILGGSRYRKELLRTGRYIQVLNELSKVGKTLVLDRDLVDREADRITRKVDDNDCNDAHIIAIIVVSKCRLVCTKDKKSHRFLFDKRLYPSGVDRPALYSGRRNANLLLPKYVGDICKKNQKGDSLRRRVTAQKSSIV